MACKDCNVPGGRKEEIDSENYKCCTNVFVLWFVFQEVEQPCLYRSSTSMYYTKCKLKNKNGEALGMRLSTIIVVHAVGS